MNRATLLAKIRYRLWVVLLLAGACAEPSAESPVAVSVAALSACDETVPADRNVDGIPSYAQCDASENSAIYSNNGVDTSTTKLGDDWVRTQYSGGYQCTELAHRYLHFKWDVDWLPNGNAGFWCDDDPPASSGIVETMTPSHGDIMVLAPGSCGASPETGHVTVVDVVDADELTVVEQNGARRGHYDLSCAKCFLHVVANTGSGGASGIGGASGASGGEGGASGEAGEGGASGEAGAAGAAVAGIGGASGASAAGSGGAGGDGAAGTSAGTAATPIPDPMIPTDPPMMVAQPTPSVPEPATALPDPDALPMTDSSTPHGDRSAQAATCSIARPQHTAPRTYAIAFAALSLCVAGMRVKSRRFRGRSL